MPQLIPLAVAGGAAAAGGTATVGGVAGLLGITSATTGLIVNTAVGTALALGASYAVAKLSGGARAPRPSDGSIERKDPLAARFFSYGLCKCSGPVLLLEVHDKTLFKITAVGTRQLATMEKLIVDDGTGGPMTPGPGGPTGADYTYTNWTADSNQWGDLQAHLGWDDQAADSMLLFFYPSPAWTSDHRLRGVPYIAARLRTPSDGSLPDHPAESRFQQAFPNGEPTFAVLGGVRLYDPRKDSTNGGSGSHRRDDKSTWEFSDNQRLACLDWLTWGDGYNKSWDRIDWASWVPQIQMADDAIPLKAGGTEKRYRVATIVSLDEPRGRVLRRIMDAGDQSLFTTRDGLIGSRGGVWQPPTVSLDASHIIEGQFTHGVAAMDKVNQFQLSATLQTHDYHEIELMDWSNVADPEFLAGVVRRQPLPMLQVPSNGQAQRLAKIRMAKINPRWSGQIRTNFTALDALGETAINLSFDELDQPDGSFDGAYLINGKIGFLADRTGMTLAVSAIDPACYDWNAATEEQDAPPVPA